MMAKPTQTKASSQVKPLACKMGSRTTTMRRSLPASVRACVTTREGGVSEAPFDSLNLGDHVDDRPEAVASRQHAEAGGGADVAHEGGVEDGVGGDLLDEQAQAGEPPQVVGQVGGAEERLVLVAFGLFAEALQELPKRAGLAASGLIRTNASGIAGPVRNVVGVGPGGGVFANHRHQEIEVRLRANVIE